MLIHDTTLRDGEQMPGVVFSREEKLRLAKLAVDFGVNFMDIMPSVSETEAEVAKLLASDYRECISATCRMSKDDIDLACRLGIEQIVLFTPLSDIQLVHKRGITREENLKQSVELIEYARDAGLIVDFAGEDSSRADIKYLTDFLGAISGKIQLFYIADTVGCLTPERTYDLVSQLSGVHETLGVHMHNDLGLATANTLAALRAGAECFSGTFTGIGERAGNAPIEEVCVALRYLYDNSVDVNYSVLTEICSLVSAYSGVPLQRHKPVVGDNAFCHESGIHADGVIKFPATYECIEPELIGRKRSFYFGKHSGRGVLRHFLADVDEETINKLLSYIKQTAQSAKYSFSEREILDLAEKLTPKWGK